MSQKTASRSELLTLALVVLMDLVGFGIMIPILPFYSKQFGASAAGLGWIMTAYSLMQFVFAPIWGRLSDHIGRKRVLTLSVFLTSASFFWMAIASTYWELLAARVFAGIFTANISTAYAYVADLTSNEDRTKAMGLLGAGFGIGFILGPAIGALLSPYGLSVPLFFAAGLSLVNGAFGLWKLKEPTRKILEAERFKRFDLTLYTKALAHPVLRFTIVGNFIVTLAVTQMEVSFALFLLDKFSLDAKQSGYLLVFTGVLMALIQGSLVGRVSKKIREQNLIQKGVLLSALGLLGFAYSDALSFAVLGLACFAIGGGFTQPCLSSLATKSSPPESRGTTMGVYQSASSLARILGPLIAGYLFDKEISLPFVMGAALLGFASVLALVQISVTNKRDT